MMLESQLEKTFRRRIRILGGMVVQLMPTVAGIPDRLVLMPGGRMYLVELKTRTGRLSPVQREWHRKVGLIGVPVVTLYGLGEVVKWVDDLGAGCDGARHA